MQFRLYHLVCGLWLLLGVTTWALPLARVDSTKLINDARQQIGVTMTYDPAYCRLTYPGGDVPLSRGVCADVIVRALRGQGMDLQQLVHEDMAKNFSKYPRNWGLSAPDTNIDHRRVPNLMTYFSRCGKSVALSRDQRDYHPGDIVAWNLRPHGFLPHIGIVSDRQGANGEPLIIHNMGNGAQEEAILFQFDIIGHYRL